MDFDEWISAYRPIGNALAEDFDPANPAYLFGLTADELRKVDSVRETDESLIWTLVEGDTGDAIIEGFHWVNRIAYLIATVPHRGEQVDVSFS